MAVDANQVLKAVLHGDSVLFGEHPELLNALVRVYFHSSLQKYNRTEYWGALKNAAVVNSYIKHCTQSPPVSKYVSVGVESKYIFQSLLEEYSSRSN